jgi:hypothetical protein
MILAMIILPMLNMKWKICFHAVKKFYKQKCQLELERSAKYISFREESELRQVPPVFSVAHAHTHTETLYRYYCVYFGM